MTLFEIFSKILNMSLTASVVIGVVFLARLALRKCPKVFSYALWAVVLFRLLCPVSLPSPVSLLGLLDTPTTQSEGVATSVQYVTYGTVKGVYRDLTASGPVKTEMTEDSGRNNERIAVSNPKVSALDASTIVASIWLAGVGVMILFGIGSYVRFRRHLTGALWLKENIYLADHIDSAFVAGLFAPKIYLPSDLPAKQMVYIIAHEQYHIRRFDHVVKHLSYLALCIHWFNPLVWVAFILSGKDMEMSCDEAVIKRLGDDIRADYSASLLALAMGRRIIAGTPLAFGEGDTKGRVLNMAKWKRPKLWVSVTCGILCIAILTACAANPLSDIVTSKNDGSFDINVVQSATISKDPDATQDVAYTEEFYSSDGTVLFQMNIEEQLTDANMPVVEVAPYFLTEEDAQRVAQVLFGDAEFYESRSMLIEEFTKSEIQEKIARWAEYTNEEALGQLMPNQADIPDEIDLIKRFIEKYTQMLDTAPDERLREPCQWTFKCSEYYHRIPTEDVDEDDPDWNDAISAQVELNGIPYVYTASIRDREDYKISNISVYLSTNEISPSLLDTYIYYNKLLRTPEPTEDQLKEAVDRAQNMLDQMNLGEWKVDQCNIVENYYGRDSWYAIEVKAVPVFNGAAALRQERTDELLLDSHYLFTNTEFIFSANGDLISFDLESAVEVKDVVNNNVAVMTVEEMMEKAKTFLKNSDYYNYGIGDPEFIDRYVEKGIDVGCKIEITHMEYNLARIKMPNEDNCYYYVPGITLVGNIEYYIEETGDLILDYQNKTLVTINGVDGSIINATNT